jgi:hypothetical protein
MAKFEGSILDKVMYILQPHIGSEVNSASNRNSSNLTGGTERPTGQCIRLTTLLPSVR